MSKSDLVRFVDRGHVPWADELFEIGAMIAQSLHLAFTASRPLFSAEDAGPFELANAWALAAKFHVVERFMLLWFMGTVGADAHGLPVQPPPVAANQWARRGRALIARQSIWLAMLRDDFATEPWASPPVARETRATLTGMLAEMDAAIALMEINVVHGPRGTFVLPAPAQFEPGRHKESNADFLVIDRVHDRVRGVQVKDVAPFDSVALLRPEPDHHGRRR